LKQQDYHHPVVSDYQDYLPLKQDYHHPVVSYYQDYLPLKQDYQPQNEQDFQMQQNDAVMEI
jgi:hypothetical protein